MYKKFFLGNAASLAAKNAASTTARAAAHKGRKMMAKVIFAACIMWGAAAGYVGAQTTVTPYELALVATLKRRNYRLQFTTR